MSQENQPASPDPAVVAEQWRAAEEAMRQSLGPAGAIPIERLRESSGLQIFEAMKRGELPGAPMADLLGFLPVEFEYGRFVFQGTPEACHFNPMGSVHGGYAAVLLDSAMACAVHTTLPAGKGYTTLEYKVNLVRAITAQTGPVRAEGKVINVGRQIGLAEGRLVDTRGNLLAFATTTCMIFSI